MPNTPQDVYTVHASKHDVSCIEDDDIGVDGSCATFVVALLSPIFLSEHSLP